MWALYLPRITFLSGYYIPEVDERRQMGAHAAATQPGAQISPSVDQIVRLLVMGAAPQVTSAAYPHVRSED
jgi:hypothetical protein